jgi:hypothetical protein
MTILFGVAMKLYIIYCFLALLLIISSCNNESNKVVLQNNIWENGIDTLYLGIENVIDFTADGKYFYFLTDKEIIKIDGYGKTISSEKQENVTGICYDPETKGLHKILKNCLIVTAKRDSIIIDINTSNLIGADKPETQFLAFDGKNYYTVIYLHGFDIISPSDQIISINNVGKNLFFIYANGYPSGLFGNENLIFYVSKSIGIEGFVRYWNNKNINDPEQFKLPVAIPIGYYNNHNNSFSYSKYFKAIIKFKVN